MIGLRTFAGAGLAVLIGVSGAVAAGPLSDSAKDATRDLGRVTGLGLYCGYSMTAAATKEVVVDTVEKAKLTERERGDVGRWYAEGRDLAFAAAQDGMDCPLPDAYMAAVTRSSGRFTDAFR